MVKSSDYFRSPQKRDNVYSDTGAMFAEWNKRWPAMREHRATRDCEKLKRRAAGTEPIHGRPRKKPLC